MSLLRASKRRRLQLDTHGSSASEASNSTTPATSCSPTPTSTTTTAQPVHPARLRHFLSWCKSRRISIDPRLDLRYTGDAVSWSVSIHASSAIDSDSVVATIPKSAVLSRKTSALSTVLQGKWLSDSPETVGLELALCLLYERCLGTASQFEPFLSILPRLPVPLPFLRDTCSPPDASPWRWISGTEAERIDQRASYSYLIANSSSSTSWAFDHDYGMCRHKALDYFHSVGIPVLARSRLFDRTQSQHLDALESAFLTAYTHVSSRDFIVDTYHGVGLVPVADLFNHTEVHTVQFEADQDVCEICGVAFLTGHTEDECRQSDGEESADSDSAPEEEDDAESQDQTVAEAASITTSDDEASAATAEQQHQAQDGEETRAEEEEEEEVADTLDMRTLAPISWGEEMFNTYGSLTNALLLTRYGFTLDTETDFERFTLDLRFATEQQAYLACFLSSGSGKFQRIGEVEKAFATAVDLIDAYFSESNSSKVGDQSQADTETGVRVGVGVDGLYRLQEVWSNPDLVSLLLCPLVPRCAAGEGCEIDTDLVERDEIHPFFLNATGRTSKPLFALTYLIHHLHTSTSSSASNLSTIFASPIPTLLQATLHTLHSFWTARLDRLHIRGHLDEALDLLRPGSDADYVEKACIQHAYQEHAAIHAALATFDEVLLSVSS